MPPAVFVPEAPSGGSTQLLPLEFAVQPHEIPMTAGALRRLTTRPCGERSARWHTSRETQALPARLAASAGRPRRAGRGSVWTSLEHDGQHRRAAHPPSHRGRLAALHEPARRRAEPLPAPARAQPGRLVSRGATRRSRKARAEGKPIFLSIGYSTCHWCHVMEEESFEDEEVAALLNAHYVAIKVDREQRPDVDAVYMTAVQAMGHGGGWPLTVWLTPDRRPFYGGTYFPPRARHAGRALRADRAAPAARRRVSRATPEQVAAAAGRRRRPPRARGGVRRRATRCPTPPCCTRAVAQLAGRLRRRARRLRRRAEVPAPGDARAAAALPPPHRRRRRARHGRAHARRHGRGRHPRSARRRLPSLRHRRRLARAALREDALRQRAARRRSTSRRARRPAAPTSPTSRAGRSTGWRAR